MWSGHLLFRLVASTVLLDSFLCNPVTTSFNSNIRSYSVKEDINSTAKTLQQDDVGRYASFAPVSNPIRFKTRNRKGRISSRVKKGRVQPDDLIKPPNHGPRQRWTDEIPDNALSGSEYSRGLLHHDQGGYGLHGYDDGHYSYGYDYDHHGLNHLENHHGHHGHHFGHGLGHGFHHKHYDPALAAKTILWPLAGLAILGTAAALVSNPVLLQLGVISGRRRRDTQEVTGPDFDLYNWNKDGTGDEVNFKMDSDKFTTNKNNKKVGVPKRSLSKRVYKDVKQGVLSKKAYQTVQSTTESVTLDALKHNGHLDEDRLVPVHLKVKRN